jgi:hypothetical protein
MNAVLCLSRPDLSWLLTSLANIVELEAKNHFKFSPYKSIKDQGSHKFTLRFSQIQADMRDGAS